MENKITDLLNRNDELQFDHVEYDDKKENTIRNGKEDTIELKDNDLYIKI